MYIKLCELKRQGLNYFEKSILNVPRFSKDQEEMLNAKDL